MNKDKTENQSLSSELNKISVIIPTYNSANFISAAIESILKQTIRTLEIIVVDDGSTDETAKVLDKYTSQIKYFLQENKGPSSARNLGLNHAVGEYILFLDSDDILLDKSMELLTKSLSNQIDTMLSIGLYQEIKKEGKTWIKSKTPYRGTYLSGVMFKKKLIDKIGMLDEELRTGEDIDWFFRLREQDIPIMFLDQVVLLYRQHKKNLSNNKLHASNGLIKACRNSIQRRKNNEGTKSLTPFSSL